MENQNRTKRSTRAPGIRALLIAPAVRVARRRSGATALGVVVGAVVLVAGIVVAVRALRQARGALKVWRGKLRMPVRRPSRFSGRTVAQTVAVSVSVALVAVLAGAATAGPSPTNGELTLDIAEHLDEPGDIPGGPDPDPEAGYERPGEPRPSSGSGPARGSGPTVETKESDDDVSVQGAEHERAPDAPSEHDRPEQEDGADHTGMVELLYTDAVVDAGPPAAKSWYVAWLSGDAGVDAERAYLRACDQARTSPAGLVVVSFGRQVAGGATGFQRDTSIPYATLSAASAGFARGLHDCSNDESNWILALGTSNNGGVTDHNGFEGGRAWAGMVDESAALSAGLRVEVVGGIDMEPAWGPPGQGRSWIDGYVGSTDRLMVNFGSADGCPRTHDAGAQCAGGWTLDDMVYVASGASPTLWMVPEIYDNNGVLAAQWATIAAHGSHGGEPVRFLGVMTQFGACRSVDDPACPRLDNTPQEAWLQLHGALAAYGGIEFHPARYATDIDW
jgi:hypothetical protein